MRDHWLDESFFNNNLLNIIKKKKNKRKWIVCGAHTHTHTPRSVVFNDNDIHPKKQNMVVAIDRGRGHESRIGNEENE